MPLFDKFPLTLTGIFVFSITNILSVAVCFAHPYLPIDEGQTTVMDYKFFVETSKKEFKGSDAHGRMIITSPGKDIKQGKTYVRFVTSYKNIPYSTADTSLWRREENGMVYAASELHGKFTETVELPKDLAVGQEWDYNDGVESRRKITQKLNLDLAGKTLTDCIEVTRVVLKNESLKNVVNKDYYCPGVGHVKYFFRQPTPVGDYITETSLVEQKQANGMVQ